ncbi:uncharacterized protein TNCV_4764991 [Trichonephila clavipes]|nr:uncharacterized protein TNCV_4764991 [Trichonephila clavipes]
MGFFSSLRHKQDGGKDGSLDFVKRLYACVIRHLQCKSFVIPFGETPVTAVAKRYRYRIVAGFVTSLSPVPLKTRRVGQRCTLNPSRAETSSHECGVVVRRGVPAQVSSTSLDHGSKLRGPAQKALV